MAQELRPLNSDQPGFSLLGFLLGTHDDVSAAAVSIPATTVDESTVKLLQRLNRARINYTSRRALDISLFSYHKEARQNSGKKTKWN